MSCRLWKQFLPHAPSLCTFYCVCQIKVNIKVENHRSTMKSHKDAPRSRTVKKAASTGVTTHLREKAATTRDAVKKTEKQTRNSRDKHTTKENQRTDETRKKGENTGHVRANTNLKRRQERDDIISYAGKHSVDNVNETKTQNRPVISSEITHEGKPDSGATSGHISNATDNYENSEDSEYKDDFEEESDSSADTSSEADTELSEDYSNTDPTAANSGGTSKHLNFTRTCAIPPDKNTPKPDESKSSADRKQVRRETEQNHAQTSVFKPINFEAALKNHRRKESLRKTQTRGSLLLSLIDLQEQTFNVLDIEPSAFSRFGMRNCSVKTTQTQDASLQEETQTDAVTCNTKWTQAPVSFNIRILKDSEGNIVEAPTQSDFRGYGGSPPEDSQKQAAQLITNTGRFNRVIATAANCILKLLDESAEQETSQSEFSASLSLSFSASAVQLNTSRVPELQHCSVTSLSFSMFDSDTLVSVHVPRESPAQQQAKMAAGYLSVWSLQHKTTPRHVVQLQSAPTCCCVPQCGSWVVAAGCQDGSVVVCDLAEPSPLLSGHQQQQQLRLPCYTTAHRTLDDRHQAEVVALRAAPSPSSLDDQRPPQMCSLDRTGLLLFWRVTTVRHTEQLTALDADLGRAPWSRTRLVCVRTMHVQDFIDRRQPHDAAARTLLRANDFCFDPADADLGVFVALDVGAVVSCNRHKGHTPHSTCLPRASQHSAAALCVDASPFARGLTVSGSDVGTMCLHAAESCSSGRPLLQWPPTDDWLMKQRRPVRVVRWSRARPSVLFCLSGDALIQVWDLSRQGDMKPAASEQLDTGTVSALDVTCHRTGRRAADTPAPQQVTLMALSGDEIGIQVHRVVDQYNNVSEHQKLAEINDFLQYVK